MTTNQPLSDKQINQLVYLFNHLIQEGQIQNLLFTIAYSEQAVMERQAEAGRDDGTPFLHKGFDDLLRIVSVPMGKA